MKVKVSSILLASNNVEKVKLQPVVNDPDNPQLRKEHAKSMKRRHSIFDTAKLHDKIESRHHLWHRKLTMALVCLTAL